MTFKLGVGPMSAEIVGIICNYANYYNKELMIIASRNQIDATSGYVMTTPEFNAILKTHNTDNIMVCRDHCGPYFLDSEKELSLAAAMTATKKTIATDIEHGFDLIHIDTSRVDDTYGVAETLIEFALDLNPNIKFEFGTEENIGVIAGANRYTEDVAFAKQFPNMQYVVAQTGSLVKEDYQAGTFNLNIVSGLAQLAEDNGIGLKEHNADYLTHEQLSYRKMAKVHAVNIAPQLGVVQTKLLYSMSQKYGLHTVWNNFAQLVLDSGKWKKWTHSQNPNTKIAVAGHYCFSSDEYKRLVEKIDKLSIPNWETELRIAMTNLFELYTNL